MNDHYEWLGKRVVARTQHSDLVHGEGVVIAYIDQPTFLIEKADGERFTWLASLTKLAPPAEETKRCDAGKFTDDGVQRCLGDAGHFGSHWWDEVPF